VDSEAVKKEHLTGSAGLEFVGMEFPTLFSVRETQLLDSAHLRIAGAVFDFFIEGLSTATLMKNSYLFQGD